MNKLQKCLEKCIKKEFEMRYIFRGIVVFEYDPLTKLMNNPYTEHGLNSFNFCKYVPEDYILISNFFRDAYLHSINQLEIKDLKDIEVY